MFHLADQRATNLRVWAAGQQFPRWHRHRRLLGDTDSCGPEWTSYLQRQPTGLWKLDHHPSPRWICLGLCSQPQEPRPRGPTHQQGTGHRRSRQHGPGYRTTSAFRDPAEQRRNESPLLSAVVVLIDGPWRRSSASRSSAKSVEAFVTSQTFPNQAWSSRTSLLC